VEKIGKREKTMNKFGLKLDENRKISYYISLPFVIASCFSLISYYISVPLLSNMKSNFYQLVYSCALVILGGC
jgi:ABC-type multidrug transport system permease subunit